MTDPLRKPVSGEEFVPSAKQFGLFIDAANSIRNQSRETKQLKAELDRGVVLVRNDTGSDLTDDHAILMLDELLINPVDDDRPGALFERPVFSGIVPVAAATGHPNEAGFPANKGFCVLQGPLRNGAIGKAIVSGVTWVKLSSPTSNGFLDYADIVKGQTGYLGTVASGPARILIPPTLIPGESLYLALVCLGTESPPLALLRLISDDEPGGLGLSKLEEGDMSSSANGHLYLWNTISASFESAIDIPFPIRIDPSFRGVAWGGTPGQANGDYVAAYCGPDAGGPIWRAVTGGHVHVRAVSDDPMLPPSGGTARINNFGGSDVDDIEITISRSILPIPADVPFDAFWLPPSVSGQSGTGSWIAMDPIKLGCGLKWDEILDESEVVTGHELNVDGVQLAGEGMEWEDEYCRFNVALDCEALQEVISAGPGVGFDSETCELTVDCSTLAPSLPCCDTICDRLDAIESRLDAIEDTILDLIECCEANTECCEEMRICCDYNTACCKYNTYCCEYLDARVDYCCGDGKPGPGEPGGGPECGRCVWEWNDAGESPTLVEDCGGGPECACDPPTTFDVPGIYFTDCASVTGSCCEEEALGDLTASFAVGGGCCIDGVSITLTKTDPNTWSGIIPAVECGGSDNTVELTCEGAGEWNLSMSATPSIIWGQANIDSFECDPFSMVISGPLGCIAAEDAGCDDCDGQTVTITISEA